MDSIEPLSVINGQTLTTSRTGAVSGVSIRHLVPINASTLGIIGAGGLGPEIGGEARKVRN